jgi:hypothetical protein
MVAWAKNEGAGSWRGTVKPKFAENGVEVKKRIAQSRPVDIGEGHG